MKNIFKHGLVQTGENNSSNNRGEGLPMSGFDTVSFFITDSILSIVVHNTILSILLTISLPSPFLRYALCKNLLFP